MRIALGPLLYYWPREQVLDFYARVESLPVDVVYLGEAVCAKRRELCPDDWLALARRLAAAGKEVIVSTLALVEAGSEVGQLRRLAAESPWPLEANDMTAVHLAVERDGFVAGPHVNVYNPGTLEFLAGLGAFRWVMPVELSRVALASLQDARPAGMETEVLVWGRMPLSFSARCFTARAAGVPKDRCGFRCLDYPQGLPMHTQDGEPLFTINGVQIQSARTLNLIGELATLRELGVDVLRISPQLEGTEGVVACLEAAVRGAEAPDEAAARAAVFAAAGTCDGYWHGRAGLE